MSTYEKKYYFIFIIMINDDGQLHRMFFKTCVSFDQKSDLHAYA